MTIKSDKWIRRMAESLPAFGQKLQAACNPFNQLKKRKFHETPTCRQQLCHCSHRL